MLQLLTRLAALMQTAEMDPVEPSPVPEISQVQSRFPPVTASDFVVTVAAPALHEAPEGSDRLAYGTSGTAWRPFGREQQPLAECAVTLAEAFNFLVRVTDFAEAGDLLNRRPGVILVDPWYIDDDQRKTALLQAASNLPRWVFPVLIPDARGDGPSAKLAAEVREALPTGSPLARRAARGVTSLPEFLTLMRALVFEAERAYLLYGARRHVPVMPPQRQTLRLVAATRSTRAASRPNQLPGHAFISYIREDSTQVAQLQELLEVKGIRVWRDTDNLWPGEDWRAKIRHAITDGAIAFLACFSRNSVARIKSYQNEELVLAMGQLRQRRPEDSWLIPIRFDDCDIPDRDIGDGRTLRSLQCIDLFGIHRGDNARKLVAAVKRILADDRRS